MTAYVSIAARLRAYAQLPELPGGFGLVAVDARHLREAADELDRLVDLAAGEVPLDEERMW